MTDEGVEVQRVKSRFSNTLLREENSIPSDTIRDWMRHPDLEVQGVVYAHITEPKYYSRIRPELSLEEYSRIILRFLRRCMLEDPSGDWADSRYEAGWDYVGWFKRFWNDPKVPRPLIEEWKECLTNLYKEGSEAVRECIATAVLEHLFSDNKIAKYFSDWVDDTLLCEAYLRAKKVGGRIVGP